MLTIVIATKNAERSLGPTLAALVPGAVTGLVSEVVVADLASTDGTLAIADAAGCSVVSADSRAGALRAGAAAARAPWLMFMRPGFVPEPHWIHAVTHFLETVGDDADWRVAMFGRGTGRTSRSMVGEILGQATALILRASYADRALLISKRSYKRLGGHRDQVGDCEADLVRRIGRRRITILDCAGTSPPAP
jgi:glycosyltransferase involved in cell wall biosynthesis